jgi:hypothetical protein
VRGDALHQVRFLAARAQVVGDAVLPQLGDLVVEAARAATRQVQGAACSVQRAACSVQRAACSVQRAACSVQRAGRDFVGLGTNYSECMTQGSGVRGFEG